MMLIDPVACYVRVYIPRDIRTWEASVTLGSLRRTEGYDLLRLAVMFTPTDAMGNKQMARSLPENAVLIEEPEGLSPTMSVRRGIELFRHTDYNWFMWVEPDILFNPSWLQDIMWLRAHADRHKVQVGAITPHRTNFRKYGETDSKPGYPWVYRKRFPMQAVLLHRTAIDCVDLDAEPLTTRNDFDFALAEHLWEQGFRHIAPRVSMAQHIGIAGLSATEKRWRKEGCGGLNFVPQPAIWDLWWKINHDKPHRVILNKNELPEVTENDEQSSRQHRTTDPDDHPDAD